jgi:hypothetical protein
MQTCFFIKGRVTYLEFCIKSLVVVVAECSNILIKLNYLIKEGLLAQCNVNLLMGSEIFDTPTNEMIENVIKIKW